MAVSMFYRLMPSDALTAAQNALPPWQIVIATLKAMVDYAGDEELYTTPLLFANYKPTMFAPYFTDYMPDMIKHLNASAPNMTFTPEYIEYATNYFGNYPEMMPYNWNDRYWAFVDALSDRTFPKIIEYHPIEYYTKPPMVITAEQYAEAVRLSSDPGNLLIYAVREIIRNIRTQYNEEPTLGDVISGIIKIIPSGVTFTENEIEFATYMINSDSETELIYSYQEWYEALSGALSDRMVSEESSELVYATAPSTTPAITEPTTKLDTTPNAAKGLLKIGGLILLLRWLFI